jgi:hypothetical protein
MMGLIKAAKCSLKCLDLTSVTRHGRGDRLLPRLRRRVAIWAKRTAELRSTALPSAAMPPSQSTRPTHQICRIYAISKMGNFVLFLKRDGCTRFRLTECSVRQQQRRTSSGSRKLLM